LPNWPAFIEKTNERMMVLGDTVGAAPGLDMERVNFYDRAYEKVFPR
jgi:hypothetical protein